MFSKIFLMAFDRIAHLELVFWDINNFKSNGQKSNLKMGRIANLKANQFLTKWHLL